MFYHWEKLALRRAPNSTDEEISENYSDIARPSHFARLYIRDMVDTLYDKNSSNDVISYDFANNSIWDDIVGEVPRICKNVI